MNKEKIKAAFRQVQNDCIQRDANCKPKDRVHCKHVDLCARISTTRPEHWGLT